MRLLQRDGYPVRGNWVEYNEFPQYAVSDEGFVINQETGFIKRNSLNQQGIAMVNMSVDNQQHVRSIAVMVANAFLSDVERPEHFDTPIHLDGDRTNCRADNLMWRPRWFAVLYHRQFTPYERINRSGFKTPVELIETGEVFPTSWEAATKYGLLDYEIYIATINCTIVFPLNVRFREVD